MNEDFNSIIAQYRQEGRDDNYIARKIFLNGEFSGQFEDALNIVSSFKKKEEAEPSAPSESPEPTQEFTPITLGSVSEATASGSTSQGVEPPETVSQRVDSASFIQSLGEEFQGRYIEDRDSTIQSILSEDEDFAAKISEIKASDKEQRQKNYLIETAFRARFNEKRREITEGYREEIIDRLPEGSDLTDVSDKLFSDFGLAVNLDENRAYNEGIGGITGMVTDAAVRLGGMIASLGSSIGTAAFVAHGGYPGMSFKDKLDYGTAAKKAAQEGIDDFVQVSTTQYDQTFTESMYNGDIGQSFSRAVSTTAESVPYILLATASAPVLGAVAATDSYMSSRAEDLSRIENGLDPMYDMDSTSGEIARTGGALIDGALTAAAGGVQARIAGTALRGLVSNPATSQTAAQVFRGYLMKQGVDISLEGAVELVQEVSNMAYKDVVAGETYSVEQYAERALESFLLGAASSTVIAAPGAGYTGLQAGRELVSGPQAAANSRVENSSKNTDIESLNADQGISKFVDSYGADKAADAKQRESFYTMLAVRHETDMNRIKQLDLSLEQAVVEYNKARGEGGDLGPATAKIESIVSQRQSIVDSHSSESTSLTSEETRRLEDGRIARTIDVLSEDVAVLSESVAAQEEYLGTEGFDQGVYLDAVQERDNAVDRKKEALRLVGELGKARKETTEASREAATEAADMSAAEQAAEKEYQAEQALRLHLGMKIEPMGEIESKPEKTQEYNSSRQFETHKENGGSTFSLDGRDLMGQPKASVSIFPERSKIVEGREITPEDLSGYLEENKDVLEGNEDVLAVGTWFDEESGNTYIDISAVLDKDIAVKLGKEYNQKAVFDLESVNEIDTGGSGEVEAGLKPEVDRIADIRTFIAPAETTVETEKAETEGVDEEVEASDVRGIEGQFTEYAPQKDGSIGVLARGPLKSKYSRFINGKLASTFNENFGGKFKFVVHDTAESGDKADKKGQTMKLGHAVINPDGSVEVHINPSRFDAAEAAGKDPMAVLVEEVFHVTLSPALAKLYRTNKPALDKLLLQMEALARKTGDKDLIAQVESKKAAYERAGAQEGEVIDEALAEYVAEMIDYKYEPTIMDKIRVILNKMIKASSGKNAITITSLDSAEKIVSAFSSMVRDGRAVKVAENVVDNTTERSAMSPSKLPENESFNMTWWQPRVFRSGPEAGLTGESTFQYQTFNGKWHFINWWKHATKMGRLNFTDFRAEIDGKEVEVNANIMRKWNMRAPIDRVAEQKRNDQKKRHMTPALISFINEQRLAEEKAQGKPYYLNQSNVGWSYKIAVDEARSFVTGEKTAAINEILEGKNESKPVEVSKEYQQIFREVLDVNDVSRIVEAMEAKYGKESSIDPIERSAVFSFFKFLDSESSQEDFELKQEQKRDAICNMGGRTCSTNDKVSLLQYESHMVKSEIGDNPSMKESVRYGARSLDVAKNHLMLEGFDVSKVVENYNEGKEVLYRRLDVNPDIKVDPRDFDGVYDLIVSYTSNGSQLDPNITLANQLFTSGVMRMQSGATDFISKERINAIAAKEADGTLESVNGQRAGAMASHLSDINGIVKQYLSNGKFDKARFFDEMRKRDKNGVPALAKNIGENTEKLADLVLGNMGDPDAIPMDSNFKDQYNIYRGKFSLVDYSEGLVIPTDVRVSVVERMKALGRDVSVANTDPELFEEIRSMKASGDDKLVSRGKQFYAELTGNNLADLRDFNVKDKNQARGFVKTVAKEMGLTPFQVQQLMYMDGIYTWNLYRKGDRFVSDYKSAQERNLQQDLSPMAIDRSSIFPEGTQMDLFSQEIPKEAKRFQTPGRRLVSEKTQTSLNATENELYRERTVEQGSKVKVRGAEVALTQKSVDEALSTDATSRRIIGKGVQLTEGQRVGIRLNLNVMKNTGVPVQTMHDKTASGEALKYAPAVTVKNATLFVNQNARNKIVTFQENKFPMASVNGDFVTEGTDLDYSGVKAVFNPFRHNVFVDMAGRPVKSAEEATVIGGNVYLRGKIEYYDMADPILESGRTESEEQRSKRIKRGPKYDKAIKRFIGYSKSQGIEFENKKAAEMAYDNMSIPSEVSVSESEVAVNMAEAMERANISGYVKGKKMRQTARKQAQNFLNTTRQAIIENPENYISPQNIGEVKGRLQDVTDQELVEFLTDESIGRLSQKNDDIGVLAGSELIRRAVARGETERIPSIVAELAAVGTTAGRILRHFRELKSSSPAGLASIVEAAVTNNGNSLSEAQKAELEKVTADLFVQQSKVEDLMRRAIGGEDVDAELKEAVEAMKTTERKLDNFTNKYIEKDWGTLFGQLVQGNLLTTMSQVFNVAANMVNAVGHVAVDLVSLPFEAAMVKIGNAMGKDIESRRRASLMAYMYGIRKFGLGFVEAADQVVTGQDQELSEWRVTRGLAPFRSLVAAFQKDLPLGPDGQGSLSQRTKLFVQGTLGIPAETMFRLLSLGDIPFRRFAEGIDLYQSGKEMGLEGEALQRFLKYPTRSELERAQREGRKLTFQEETAASQNVSAIVSSLEGIVARGVEAIGIDGTSFAKALFKVILPFRSTPANILYETFTWVNPYVGTVRMASQLRRGEVEESSKTLAKMMLGSVTMEAALMMISEGIISGPVKWDEDEEKNMAYDIFPPSSINVSALRRLIEGGDSAHQTDDYFMRYDKLGMIGAIMSTAVQSVDTESLREREYNSPMQFASHTLSDFFGAGSMSAISAMMEQSFVQGLNGFLKVLIGDNVERDLENFLTTMFKAGSAAVLPNQLNAFYRAERTYLPDSRVTKEVGEQGGVMGLAERLAKKFEYTIKDRTFGLADYPVRINWKGEKIEQTPRGATGIGYQLFDVTKSMQGSADPLSNEIWRLYEQTEDMTSLCGTPSYASTRKFSVPNITSKKDIKMVRDLGRGYTWINDEEFMAERIYLSTEQINELMQVSGRARYEEAMKVVQTKKYKEANDQDKVEMLNEVADEFNSAKEYGPNGYRRHTVLLFDVIQKIYDAR